VNDESIRKFVEGNCNCISLQAQQLKKRNLSQNSPSQGKDLEASAYVWYTVATSHGCLYACVRCLIVMRTCQSLRYIVHTRTKQCALVLATDRNYCNWCCIIHCCNVTNEERISGVTVGNNYQVVDHHQVRRLSEKLTTDSWVLFQLTASFKLESSLCASSCLCVSRNGVCYR
jgi:hypothetical protein